MKRVLESPPEPGDSLGGGTRAKTTQASSSYIQVSDTTNNDFKRFKGPVVNGLIVYTRERKSRFNWSTGLSENGHNKQLCSSDEAAINVNASLEEGCNGKKVQIVLGDEPTCKGRELVLSPAKETGAEGITIAIAAESSEGKNDLPEEEVSLFTSSLVRPKVKPEPPESLVNASDAAQNEENLYLDRWATGGVSSTLENKLGLKTSKKIGLNTKPMTVRELFETGLLDGVTVVYVGCNKFQGSGLRGTIRDGGILCSCTSCNGCRVIPPSKFEIHASKTYKRAAQYICLENGKSLLDLLRACRASSLNTLESTIQNIIGSPPEEKYFTCKRCKGCFPKSCVARIGLLCNSCVDSQESHGTPNSEDVKILGSPKRVPFSKNSKSASACFPAQNKRPWKITTKPSKSILISRSSKSASLSIPSQNKTKWKITTKDQRLHKLVFEEGGLPDGSEVAYYARGQKLLEGYKMGFGILCRCCNSEVSASQFEAHAGWASRRKPWGKSFAL